MKQQGHKTEGVNRTKRVRFYPFSFTGKEKDEETGYGYFGARYMDHKLTTMWLSVDPMMDKYPNISPYNYCMWNPIRVIGPDGRDTVKIFLDKGRFLYQKAEGDHCIKFCRAEVTLEEMTIPREECETIKELERATGRYSEEGKSLPYTTQYLEFSNPLWGKSVFKKIAKLGATREQVSKEWDYHILGSTGELSSSGIHNRMIHKNGRYSIFKEWHHFHPFNNDESYYPSMSDQDKARANPASTCTIYSQGKHFEFGGELPRKGYIDLKKFGNTWRKFAR
jgi:RHS repeat-associated protein